MNHRSELESALAEAQATGRLVRAMFEKIDMLEASLLVDPNQETLDEIKETLKKIGALTDTSYIERALLDAADHLGTPNH